MFKLPFIVYGYLILQMSVIWIIYRLLKNPSVVDVSWSLGLMVSGLIYLSTLPFSFRSTVISLLLVLWGLRLALYLWLSRVRKGHVDKRYLTLSDTWKFNKSLGFFLNFQLQAILIFIISGVFYFICMNHASELSLIEMIGCGVIVIGVLGESLADLQLQRFKKHYPGKVCNLKLWHYSRHPNYFFDWLTWCGFTLLALFSNYGFLAVISPLCLYIIFTCITGPMTERGSIRSRGKDYLNYQKSTSMFFPWFTKKNNF